MIIEYLTEVKDRDYIHDKIKHYYKWLLFIKELRLLDF